MVNGGAEPRQRIEMLGHAVALVMLEAVTRIDGRPIASSAGRG